MLLNRGLDKIKAEAYPLVRLVFCLVQSTEALEQSVDVHLGDTWAMVSDGDVQLFALQVAAQFNLPVWW